MKKTLLIFLAIFAFSKVQAQFSVSFQAGQTDVNGKFMSGTEMRVLANHKGKLYGGTETWMDDTTGTCDPFIGAMIVRLDAPNQGWKLDKHFDTFDETQTGRERKKNEGITALESIIFTTDKNGVALPTPDTILIAAARDFSGELAVYTRNDANGVWTQKVIGSIPTDTASSNDNDGTIRSFILYKDKETGIDRVFAGSLPNGIISGRYDASLPGKILWDTQVELTGFVGRPMAFAICNGDLFCAIAPDIWRRNDGENPTWTSVFNYPFVVQPGGSSGLRGLTTIKNPSGSGQTLLAALEGSPSQIFRLNLTGSPPYTATAEYNTLAELSTAFGYPANYLVIANSEMTWIREPVTGDSVLAISVQHHPALLRDDAFYLIRKQVGANITYTLRRIDNTFFAPFTVLNSTRAIVNSPFANDNNAIYLGGYDADNNVSHNTAYVLRCEKNTFFGIGATQTQQVGLKRHTFQPSLTQADISNDFFAHAAYLNTALTPKNKLLLFLPGTGSPNSAYENFLKETAMQGYHVLGLAYSNAETISERCAGKDDSLCFDKCRNEVLDGIDRTTEVNVNVANSIYNRTLKALQYLQNTYPTENWGQYFSGNTITWSKIMVSGHSQGGGHAALIAKQNVVNRVLMFASPKDYFKTPLNKVASWIKATSLTPTQNYFAFTHKNDGQGCTPTQQLEILNRLGLGAYGVGVEVENNNSPYNNTHILLSSVAGLTSNNAHAVIVVDVLAASRCKIPVFAPVWRYMLNSEVTTALEENKFDNYLSAFPNPVQDRVVIQNKERIFIKEVVLVDMFGRKVFNQSIQSSEENISLTLQNQVAGLYLMQLQSNKGLLMTKVVIQK